MNIIDVANGYKEIVSALEGAGVSVGRSVLAGGVVRDAIMGIEPKDWDFYAEFPDSDYNFDFHKQMTEAGFAEVDRAIESFGGHWAKALGNYEIAGRTVNTLRMWEPRPWEHFDLVCCVGAYDGIEFINLDAAATDIAAGTLALTTADLSREQRFKTIERVEKFEQRYGWKRCHQTTVAINKWRRER